MTDADILAMVDRVRHTAQAAEAAREVYRLALEAERPGSFDADFSAVSESDRALGCAQNALLVAAGGIVMSFPWAQVAQK